MKGFLSLACVAFIAVAALLSVVPVQASGALPFFNASGDTREVDTSAASDTGALTPSVPLGYPIPSAQSSAPSAASTAPDQPGSKNNPESKMAAITYSVSTKTLTLVIPSSQNVKVSAHVLNGQTISRFSTRKFLTQGTHTIKLDNAALANGVIVLSLEGEGFSIVKRINLAEDR
jgi:hypothetical protein